MALNINTRVWTAQEFRKGGATCCTRQVHRPGQVFTEVPKKGCPLMIPVIIRPPGRLYLCK